MNRHNSDQVQDHELLIDRAGSLVDRLFLALPEMIKWATPVRKISPDEYERQLDFYIDSGFIERPETFFTFPVEVPSYAVMEKKPYYDGECQVIRYKSGYEVKNPFIREHYDSFIGNRTCYLVRWTHGDRKRRTVLCHHGYMLGNPRQARRMFRVDTLFNLGLDVALFIAPFHWKRRAGLLARRGIYLQPDNVVMTAECVGQNMHDLHGAFQILYAMETSEVGLIGASLGAYNTALFISLSDISSFGAMMVPAFNFSRPLDTDAARLPFETDDSMKEKMRSVWQFHSPLNFKPKIPVERILVVASKGDLVCPFNFTQDLCDSWGIGNRHFLSGGHWLIADKKERGRAWYRFIADMGFTDARR